MGKEKVPMNIFFIGHVDPGQSTTIGHLIDKLGGIDQRVIKTAEKKDPTRAKGVIKTAEKKDPTGAKGVIKTTEKKDPTGAKGVIKTTEKKDPIGAKGVIKTAEKDPTRTKGVIKIVEKDTTRAKGVIMTGAKVTKVTKVTKHVIKTVEKIDYCANTKSVEKEEKKTRWLDIQRTTAVGVIKRVERKDPTGAKVTKAATKKGAK